MSPTFTTQIPKISVSSEKPRAVAADVLAVPIYAIEDALKVLPPAIAKEVQAHARKVSFTAALGSTEVFISPDGLQARFIALIGLGEKDAPIAEQAEGLRRGIAGVVEDSRRHMSRTIAVVLQKENQEALAGAAIEGSVLADYRFSEYRAKLKEEQKSRSLKKLIILASSPHEKEVKKIVKETEQALRGVTLARDLVNQPASHMSPKVLVDTAKKIAKGSAAVSVSVLNRQQALKKGFTAFLAVARGSKEEPYVIHLVYKPAKKAKKKVALVGKGITFDSGGLSLKPAQPMEQMKIDMAGAATVIGVFSVLQELKPEVEVHGIIAACENMPSGEAYRPGDVLTAMNGKTIEVTNTDAEGRVTLADALSYAEKQKPDVIIDLATLTGAVVVALGETHSGLWSTDDKLKDSLLEAANISGEGIVELPLPSEYESTIESKIADIRNTATTGFGGATTAAMFLRHFVEKTPWAHLDIAGPAFMERPLLPYYPFGATGFGVRTLLHFLKRYTGTIFT